MLPRDASVLELKLGVLFRLVITTTVMHMESCSSIVQYIRLTYTKFGLSHHIETLSCLHFFVSSSTQGPGPFGTSHVLRPSHLTTFTISGPLIVNVLLIAVLLVHTQFFIGSHSVFLYIFL